VQNRDGWTPLHEASWYGYLDMIRLLLEHGANVEATNNNRRTPLHLATQNGQLAAVQLLVEHGSTAGI
jgi:ankyrin repeat protein